MSTVFTASELQTPVPPITVLGGGGMGQQDPEFKASVACAANRQGGAGTCFPKGCRGDKLSSSENAFERRSGK